jgi:predicted PurR-regulated permease PerM
MSEIDPIKVGVMWSKVESMEKEMSEMRHDIKELLAMANKSRGGFWMGMAIVSAISGLISFIAGFYHK